MFIIFPLTNCTRTTIIDINVILEVFYLKCQHKNVYQYYSKENDFNKCLSELVTFFTLV